MSLLRTTPYIRWRGPGRLPIPTGMQPSTLLAHSAFTVNPRSLAMSTSGTIGCKTWESRGPGTCRLFKWTAEQESITARWQQVQHVPGDRKSTRLNSSHLGISDADFCLKKNVDLLPKVNVELVVPSERTDEILNTISAAARTGKIGVFFLLIGEPQESTRFPNAALCP